MLVTERHDHLIKSGIRMKVSAKILLIVILISFVILNSF